MPMNSNHKGSVMGGQVSTQREHNNSSIQNPSDLRLLLQVLIPLCALVSVEHKHRENGG